MAFTLQQLKSEIQNDPNGLGLLALYNNGQDEDVAQSLNLSRAGVAYSIFRSSVTVRELIKNIVSSEFSALTQLQLAKLNFLFLGTATLDATDANTRDIITDTFSGKPSTLANFAILAKKQGSRAEVLWGDGTVVNNTQVAQTRNI